jgi:hypothetical protein
MMLAVLIGSVQADDFATPKVVFPTEKVVTPDIVTPTVVTKTEEKQIDTLTEEQWYIIQADTPLIVLSSPSGIVSVAAEVGPVRLRGKFAGGTGAVETRVFDMKHVYSISAVKPGTVELIVVPVGVDAESSILRRSLVVSGTGPLPPPKPDVDPDVVPVPPVPRTDFKVLFLTNEDMSKEQSDTVFSTEIRSWLKANVSKIGSGGDAFRSWDRTTVSLDGALNNEAIEMRSLYEAVRSRVAGKNLVVAQSGTDVWITDLSDPSTVLSWLKSKKEGK